MVCRRVGRFVPALFGRRLNANEVARIVCAIDSRSVGRLGLVIGDDPLSKPQELLWVKANHASATTPLQRGDSAGSPGLAPVSWREAKEEVDPTHPISEEPRLARP